MTPQQKESFDEFIRNLAKAASASSLYGKQHRMTVSRATESLVFLSDSLKDDNSATVMHLGNDLFVNGLPLDKGPHPDRLMRAMKDYGMDHSTYDPDRSPPSGA
jgi:hypothetical protein